MREYWKVKDSEMKQLMNQNKQLKYFFWCNSISKMGDFIDDIAFAQLAYLITNSTLYMALIYIIKIIFSFFAVLFAPLIDKVNKKFYLCFCESIQAFNLFVIALLYIIGEITPEILLFFTILQGICSTSSAPVKDSLLPLIVNKEDLQKARAGIMSVEKIIEISAYAISVFLIINTGYGLAFFLDASTFIFTAFLYSKMDIESIHVEKEQIFKKEDILSGFRFVISMKMLIVIMFYTSLCNFVLCPFSSLLPALFSQGGYNVKIYPIYMMLYALGGFIASSFMIKHQVKTIRGILSWGYLTIGLSIMFICFYNNILPLISAIFLGISTTCITSINMNTIQVNTPSVFMTQVMSLFRFICVCFGPLGILIAGIAGECFPLKNLYLIAGTIVFMIAISSLFFIEDTNGYSIKEN